MKTKEARDLDLRRLSSRVAVAVFGWPDTVYITDERHDPNRPIFAWRECHREHGEWEDCQHAWDCGGHEFCPAPDYATEIAAAWQVVEKMRERGFGFAIDVETVDGQPLVGVMVVRRGVEADESAPTAPLAICRAAIAALEAERVTT